jgi:hypothetical protein
MQAVRERKDTSGTLEVRSSTALQSNYRRLVMKILAIRHLQKLDFWHDFSRVSA